MDAFIDRILTLVNKLVDRLGRKLTMVLVGCYFIFALPVPEVMWENAQIVLFCSKLFCITSILITNVIMQGRLDNVEITKKLPDV